MRLDKFLSQAGAGTRSEVKKLIGSGSVSVDGKPIRDAAFKVDEGTSCVCIKGKAVRYAGYEYYMLNKPQGVICASKDETGSGNICATDLIADKIRNDLFPAGRLDKDTEGLVLITNDGDLSHRLLSPKRHVDKRYYVRLSGTLSDEAALRLEAGVDIGDEKPTLACIIEKETQHSCYITIHEGRYHQIKRMFKSEGLEVVYLKRLSMGPLKLDETLGPGQYRPLTKEELAALKEI